jgi:hypothetical protein
MLHKYETLIEIYMQESVDTPVFFIEVSRTTKGSY